MIDNVGRELDGLKLPRPAPGPDAAPVRPRARGIEYFLDIPCEPKRRFGRRGLVDRLRRRDRAQESPPPTPQEISDARMADFQLRPVTFHCARCPANVTRREFGCYGVIRYPISAEAEEWMAECLPKKLKLRQPARREDHRQVEATKELLRRMNELGVTGEEVDAARCEGILVERPTAARRRYGTLFRPHEVESSRILQLLFLRRRIHPAIGELVCRALGLWTDGGTTLDGVPEAVFTSPVEGDDDASVAELKQFFLALMIARSLDLEVVTLADGISPEAHDDLGP